jgi:hypothetical protein
VTCTAGTVSGAVTTITGNVGIYPGNSIVAEDQSLIIEGSLIVYPNSLEVLINIEEAEVCLLGKSPITETLAAEIGGLTLAPGIYAVFTSATITNLDLTLDGTGNPNAYWIFNIPASLTIAAARKILLVNALPGNVYWLVGTSVTIDAHAIVVGNIIATKTITINAGALLNGRAFSLTDEVYLDANNIVAVPCSINLCPSLSS